MPRLNAAKTEGLGKLVVGRGGVGGSLEGTSCAPWDQRMGVTEQSHRRYYTGDGTTAVKRRITSKTSYGIQHSTLQAASGSISRCPRTGPIHVRQKGKGADCDIDVAPTTPRTSCRPGFGRRALSAVSCPREHELTFPASFFLITQPSYITPKRWSTPEPSRLLTSSFHFHRSCLVCIHSLRERLVLVYYTPGRHSLSWHSSLSLRACGVLTFLSYPVSLTLSTILRDG